MTEPRVKVAIIGAGPAGLSAAIWLKHFQITPELYELSNQAGGLPWQTDFPNHWVLGQPDVNGPELARRFLAHADSESVTILADTQLTSVVKKGEDFIVDSNHGQQQYQAILLCTGTRFGSIESFSSIDGFSEIKNDILSDVPESLTQGKGTAVVIGGGDNAFEAAHALCQLGKKTTLLIRTAIKAAAWSRNLLRSYINGGQAELITGANITKFTKHKKGICLHYTKDDFTKKLTAEYVIAKTGVLPNTESVIQYFGEALALDEHGYIKTSEAMRTNINHVYAAGDVANPKYPSVVAAIAQGAIAAKTIELDLREQLIKPC